MKLLSLNILLILALIGLISSEGKDSILDSDVIDHSHLFDLIESNMEMQINQDSVCGGATVQIPIYSRALLSPIFGCITSNSFSFEYYDYELFFVINFVDNGNVIFSGTKSVVIDANYVANNNSSNPYDLGDGFSIYFNDTDWQCSSGTDCSLIPNVAPSIGECDSDTPLRPDLPPTGVQNNFGHVMLVDIPGTIVGPAIIDFNGTYEGFSAYIYTPGSGLLSQVGRIQAATGTVTGPGASDPLQVNIGRTGGPTCNNGPLAITLLNFTGEQADNGSNLNWSINADEPHTIELEHSVDAFNFNSIGNWDFQGVAEDIIEQSFLHENPFTGLNYYRLKIIKETGAIEYSDLVSLNFDGIESLSVSVSPNPTADFVNVQSNGLINSIEIFDLSGRLINNFQYVQSTNRQIDLFDLADGTYIIRISTEIGIETERIIKF